MALDIASFMAFIRNFSCCCRSSGVAMIAPTILPPIPNVLLDDLRDDRLVVPSAPFVAIFEGAGAGAGAGAGERARAVVDGIILVVVPPNATAARTTAASSSSSSSASSASFLFTSFATFFSSSCCSSSSVVVVAVVDVLVVTFVGAGVIDDAAVEAESAMEVVAVVMIFVHRFSFLLLLSF